MASALSFKPSFENPAAWRDVKSQQRRLRLRTERPAMPQPNGEAEGSAFETRKPVGCPVRRLVLNSPRRKSFPRKRLTLWCEIVAPDTPSDASDGARPSDRRAGMVPLFLPLDPQGERVQSESEAGEGQFVPKPTIVIPAKAGRWILV